MWYLINLCLPYQVKSTLEMRSVLLNVSLMTIVGHNDIVGPTPKKFVEQINELKLQQKTNWGIMSITTVRLWAFSNNKDKGETSY